MLPVDGPDDRVRDAEKEKRSDRRLSARHAVPSAGRNVAAPSGHADVQGDHGRRHHVRDKELGIGPRYVVHIPYRFFRSRCTRVLRLLGKKNPSVLPCTLLLHVYALSAIRIIRRVLHGGSDWF